MSLEAATSESRCLSARNNDLLVLSYDVRIKDDEGFAAYFDNVRPDEIRLYEV